MTSYFLNLRNGVATIDDHRLPDAAVTDMDDIVSQFGNDESETLTLSLDLWIKEEASKVLSACSSIKFDNIEEFRNYVLGEVDFLDATLDDLNIDHTQDPEIRRLQLDEYDNFCYENFEDNI